MYCLPKMPESADTGRALLASLNQAVACARSERVPSIRVTYVHVDHPAPTSDLRSPASIIGLHADSGDVEAPLDVCT
jgi:hypothetical protein